MTPAILYGIGPGKGNCVDLALSLDAAKIRCIALRNETGEPCHVWAVRVDLDSLDDCLVDVDSKEVTGALGEVFQWKCAGEIQFEENDDE